MRFSIIFQLGALAALSTPALARPTGAGDAGGLASLGGVEHATPEVLARDSTQLDRRRDAGLNSLPKKPAPKPQTRFPLERGGGPTPQRGVGRTVRTRPARPPARG